MTEGKVRSNKRLDRKKRKKRGHCLRVGPLNTFHLAEPIKLMNGGKFNRYFSIIIVSIASHTYIYFYP